MSSANWPHSGERYDDPSDSVQFVQPSIPAEGETPPPVVSPERPAPMPAEDTVEGRLFKAMAAIRALTADVQWDTAAGRHESVRLSLGQIIEVAKIAVQTSYHIETPDPDYRRLLVDAVALAVKHRNRYLGGSKTNNATYRDVYRALRGDFLPDGSYAPDDRPERDERVDRAMNCLDELIESKALYRTSSGAFIGVRNGLPDA